MKIILLLLFGCMTLNASSQTSVYDFHEDSIIGNHQINFSDFEGKKILIINSASLDMNLSQLVELQKLHVRYGDSLVILVFPSNDFHTEPADNPQIALFLQKENLTYIIGAKIFVTGERMNPLYKWLTSQTLNDKPVPPVTQSFQKFLIDQTGHLTHIFSASTRPLNQYLINAINE